MSADASIRPPRMPGFTISQKVARIFESGGPPSNFKPLIPRREELATMSYVDADPYKWPYNGDLKPSNTCIIVIDMQVDFCAKGGYVDKMGYDLSLTRAPIEPIQKVLACMRKAGYHILHTREGHRPDLADCPPNKLWRSAQMGAKIGSAGPCGRILVKGEPGWDIIPEVYPLPNEIVIDKPGKGSFIGTNLELILKSKGICNIVRGSSTFEDCWWVKREGSNTVNLTFGFCLDPCGSHDGCLCAHNDARCQRHGLRMSVVG